MCSTKHFQCAAIAAIAALGRKASDEFAVPPCRSHHRAAHRAGDERGWGGGEHDLLFGADRRSRPLQGGRHLRWPR
jgi:hypothetical protein